MTSTLPMMSRAVTISKPWSALPDSPQAGHARERPLPKMSVAAVTNATVTPWPTTVVLRGSESAKDFSDILATIMKAQPRRCHCSFPRSGRLPQGGAADANC